ncbi:MAG: iron-sulfur cluster assembly accessory protein [Verrucomicrobiota bacterium]
MITVTDSAIAQLREILAQKGVSPEEKGLRLGVERGGCAGMQYTMQVGEAGETDEIVEKGGVRFIVAADSVEFLKGSEVDYEDSLNDSGFKIQNPLAARSCGCGTSFEMSGASTEGQPIDESSCGS